LGKSGFVEVARHCLAKADYLRKQLTGLPGVSDAQPGVPVFNEFAITLENSTAAKVLRGLETKGIIGGFDLGKFDSKDANKILIAVTEQHTREDLDEFTCSVGEVLSA
jgi:glycine dehydrogenase subunit 1